MEYLIGLMLSLAVAGSATVIGFDRDRVFYPTVLIVIASYYVLFAVIGASERTLIIENRYCKRLFATRGTRLQKKHLWLVATAIVGHGVFDFVHHFFIDNPGVPHWWPGFCLAFDVLFGGLLAVHLIMHPNLSRNPAPPNWR
jgi:hypothetical protein